MRGAAAALFLLAVPAAARTVYVSPDGSDANSGISQDAPLRSLAAVAKRTFEPGDSLLLKGGAVFKGSLSLSPDFVKPPIEISSYGGGSAVIESGSVNGLEVRDLGDVRISHLALVGSGATNNTADGIFVVNDLKGGRALSNVRVEAVDVSGYGGCGIRVHSEAKGSGFRGVLIRDAVAHDNGLAGIASGAVFPDQPHEDLTIEGSIAHHNRGRPGYKSHSGNGIMISGVRGALMEHNLAYENGELCDSPKTGGPVGIWAWNADRVVVQFNVSHHNHTGNRADGGGFDADGDVTNSVFRYNFSTKNDGYGFMFCDFSGTVWGGAEFRNVEFDHNVSLLDGAKTDVGGFLVYGPIFSSQFRGNVVFSEKSYLGTPANLQFSSWSGKDVEVVDNFFYSNGGAPAVKMESSRGSGLILDRNFYWSREIPVPVSWNGTTYARPEEWATRTGYERHGSFRSGACLSPEPFDLSGRARLEEHDFRPIFELVEALKDGRASARCLGDDVLPLVANARE